MGGAAVYVTLKEAGLECRRRQIKLGERKKIKDRKLKDKKGVLASAGTDTVWLGVVVVRKAGAGESIVIVLL